MAEINKIIEGLESQFYDLQKFADEDQPLALTQEQANEILELLKSQQAEIKKLKLGSRVVPCASCTKRGTVECIIGMASVTDRTVHGCNFGEWKDGNGE